MLGEHKQIQLILELNLHIVFDGTWDLFPRYISLAQWVECSPMVRQTWVQSQVASYQRHKKWYLIPPCLTLRNIRYVSRVKWSNPGKRVAPSSIPWCSSYWKGSLQVTLDNGRQLYLYIYIYIYTYPVLTCEAEISEVNVYSGDIAYHYLYLLFPVFFV